MPMAPALAKHANQQAQNQEPYSMQVLGPSFLQHIHRCAFADDCLSSHSKWGSLTSSLMSMPAKVTMMFLLPIGTMAWWKGCQAHSEQTMNCPRNQGVFRTQPLRNPLGPEWAAQHANDVMHDLCMQAVRNLGVRGCKGAVWGP